MLCVCGPHGTACTGVFIAPSFPFIHKGLKEVRSGCIFVRQSDPMLS